MIYLLSMKKNIILILLSAALLTGCEFDISLQRLFSGKQEEQETQQTDEENSQNSEEKPQNSEENNNNSGDEGHNGEQGGNNQTPIIQNEYVAEIKTSGTAISNFATSAGVQVDSDLSSGAGNAAKLTSCLKAQLEHEECLSTAWYEKINTGEWDNECIVQIGTGNPAKNNFNPGTFKWNSTGKIYKVEITAICYSKPSYSEDSNAKLKIDNDEAQALKSSTEETLQFKTIVKEYENGTNSLTIQSIDGRVFLKALKITWSL